MDDGGNPLIGMLVFVLFLLLDALLYGFLTALNSLNDRQVEKLAEGGGRRGLWLLKVKEEPFATTHVLQIIMTFISVILGIYQGRIYGRSLIRLFPGAEESLWLIWCCHGVSVLVLVFLLAALSILLPQKIAIRKAEKWALGLAGVMRVLVAVFWPIGFLAEKLSNLFLCICGMDPNENVDDVTEEEIISMVNEGHEHGVLKASEAEMIHNIFEFDDKEARDIMTHRKNIVALEAQMTLAEALDFMLEKNNSRFPVYQEDIDNILGILHIKDAMLLSRDSSRMEQPIMEIEGLVRQVRFIPETRNINSLFQAMQSQKNHLVIVVDEYGQTAGLVAMEDILEEIVGNILDEYDEEDELIVKQTDGSFLMKGMASLDDVCEALELTEELEDYDTLNGYLISLIDKIPGDHEVFEVSDHGYLFQVLHVENKMIQTVKVTRLASDESEPGTESDLPGERVHDRIG
ncbi:MAG: HlyC/CorC family transporter [Lachnospiraceae bacterium]|nr:HlyC/CorC family transporter [Lachnospiraceae bacterium]